ncbi:hypothetical protein M422DRAFT_779872 [Sphaerobolus stellatus SS14]|uniref:F-box domain-containing protein n=1 Tax=Sphaerobolus stellatus (strain SS14) TaxID=990650 RepID=A0A0C9V7J9_SPHS4|nr:hypothetical protein M422DRAFT_779872 [Sphaerobolus stellatus SS14]
MLAEFGRARPRIALLPSLRQLTLNAKNAQYASLFIHPDLVKLVVHLDARFLEAWGMTGINNFLLELPTFSPGLQALVIRASYSVTKIQATLCEMFPMLPCMQEVSLPRYWLTPKIILALAMVRSLRRVDWEYIANGQGELNDITNFVTPIFRSGFHNLSDLSLEIDIPVAHRFLASSGLFKQLSSFFIRTVNVPTPSHLRDLLQVFFENGSILKKLFIDGFPNSPRAAEKESIVTSETLEAILDSSQLTHFSLYWPAHLHIMDTDIELLSRKSPKLQRLSLGPWPYFPAAPSLTLEALFPLLRNCPKMEYIGLYIDTTIIPPIPKDIRRPFKRMHIFNFGFSHLDDGKTEKMALLLSRLCTLQPHFQTLSVLSGPGWEMVYRDAYKETDGSYKNWKTVSQFLPMLVTCRDEERLKVRQVTKQLEALTMH